MGVNKNKANKKGLLGKKRSHYLQGMIFGAFNYAEQMAISKFWSDGFGEKGT